MLAVVHVLGSMLILFSLAYLLPIWGIVLGGLVLSEPIDARLLAGTALVIAGIGLVNMRGSVQQIWRRRPAPEPTAPEG